MTVLSEQRNLFLSAENEVPVTQPHELLAQGYVREINIRGAEDSYDLLSPRGREIVGVHPPSRCPA